MVVQIRNHHIAGPVHRQDLWGVEASEDDLTILQGSFFLQRVPNNGGQPARGRQLEDGVLPSADMTSAVGQHKDTIGKTEPRDADSGRKFEG